MPLARSRRSTRFSQHAVGLGTAEAPFRKGSILGRAITVKHVDGLLGSYVNSQAGETR